MQNLPGQSQEQAPIDVTPNVFRLWTAMHAPTPGLTAPAGVAFDITAATGTEVLLWRLVLPANERLAHERLDAASTQLHAVDIALRQCQDRITALVDESSRGVSFALSSASPLPNAEQQLLLALGDMPHPRQPVAFGLDEGLSARWRQMTGSLQSFMDRLAHLISHYAWVETAVGDRLIGRTVLGWNGDMYTLWRSSTNDVHVELHERALEVALGSRQRLAQVLVTACHGAVLLASLPAMLATPLGAVAALPAAWKFVSQVVTLLDTAE